MNDRSQADPLGGPARAAPAEQIVHDGPRAEIEPLLPPSDRRRFRYAGRKPIDDRKALTGVLLVPRTGIP